jgi:DNA ligase-1
MVEEPSKFRMIAMETPFPTLYKKTSTGAIQQWNIHCSGNKIVTTWGQVDGAIQQTVDVISEGKNAGRKNATTPEEQARAEAESKWEKQLKKGYVQSLEEAEAGKVDACIEGGVAAMLAHKFDEHGHKIKFPAFISPKLDGIRCIATIIDGKASLWSRTRKPIRSCPHIVSALEQTFPRETLTLDGELYSNDYRDNFNKIISLVRPDDPVPGHEIVEYHVFDLVDGVTFSDRYQRLVAAGFRSPLMLVEQQVVSSEEEAMNKSREFMEAGFEGGMVKNATSPYEHKRSYHIQKIKFMSDSEFPIVGIEEGRGKLAGHVGAFICRTQAGVEFKAKLKGDLDVLRTFFTEPERWRGKSLTVRFQNMTPDGAPRFPVGIAVRDYE